MQACRCFRWRVARGKFAGWLPRFLESALAVIEEGSSPAGAHAIGHFLESNALALTRHAERILAAASRDLQSSLEDEYATCPSRAFWDH